VPAAGAVPGWIGIVYGLWLILLAATGPGLASERLDDTYVDIVDKVARDLVAIENAFDGVAVNRPGSKGDLRVEIRENASNAYADLATKTIVLGASTLRRWATASALWPEDYDRMEMALIPLARPEDQLRKYWDPKRNPSLAEMAFTVEPGEFFMGMLAYTLAHEMYHLLSPPSFSGPRSRGERFSGRAAQLASACPEYMDSRVELYRTYESQADQYAAGLLVQIPHEAGGGGKRLKYEFGTAALGNHMMGEELIQISAESSDAFLRQVVRSRVRPEFYALLASLGDGSDPKEVLIGKVFTNKHPATVERLLRVTATIRAHPRSAFYGERGATGRQDLLMWNMLKRKICEEVAAKR